MTKSRAVLIAACLSAAANRVGGEEPGKPKMDQAPKAPQQLGEAFKFFDGPWKCVTKFAEGAMGPGSPAVTVNTTVRFKKDLDGWFYRGDYEAPKTKSMPSIKGDLRISYQPGAQVFVMTSHDNTGAVEYATSPGFRGDSIAFTGEAYMMGQKMAVRETMTKRGKECSHTTEIDRGKGFEAVGEDSCKR